MRYALRLIQPKYKNLFLTILSHTLCLLHFNYAKKKTEKENTYWIKFVILTISIFTVTVPIQLPIKEIPFWSILKKRTQLIEFFFSLFFVFFPLALFFHGRLFIFLFFFWLRVSPLCSINLVKIAIRSATVSLSLGCVAHSVFCYPQNIL